MHRVRTCIALDRHFLSFFFFLQNLTAIRFEFFLIFKGKGKSLTRKFSTLPYFRIVARLWSFIYFSTSLVFSEGVGLNAI